jgi:hypothetical protein
VAKDRLELEAYAEHHAGRPYLDRVTLRWFTTADGEARLYETGGADWSVRGATVFASGTPKHPTAQLDGPATMLVYLGFGKTHAAITDNRDFRIALDAGDRPRRARRHRRRRAHRADPRPGAGRARRPRADRRRRRRAPTRRPDRAGRRRRRGAGAGRRRSSARPRSRC